MEARALYAFTPAPEKQHDQLAFQAGEQIIVTSFVDDEFWFRAEIHRSRNGSGQSSPSNSMDASLNQISPQGGHQRTSSVPHKSLNSSPAATGNRYPSGNQVTGHYGGTTLRHQPSSVSTSSTSRSSSSQFQVTSFSTPQKYASMQHSRLPTNLNQNTSMSSLNSRRSSTHSTGSGTLIRTIARGFAPKSYFQLEDCPWFYGPVNRPDSEHILRRCTDGEFIVRQNVDTLAYCLSVLCSSYGGVQHYKILRDQIGNFLINMHKFASINKLVEYYKTHALPAKQRLIPYRLRGHPKWQHRLESPNDYLYKAQHNFDPLKNVNSDDQEATAHAKQQMAIKQDDLIVLLDERGFANDGWWLGQAAGNGESYFQVGLFPKDYVVRVGNDTVYAATR